MSRDVIVGVDAGTSVIKAVAFDLDGREIASTGLPNCYVDLPGGGVEQDMARTWTDTPASLRMMSWIVLIVVPMAMACPAEIQEAANSSFSSSRTAFR